MGIRSAPLGDLAELEEHFPQLTECNLPELGSLNGHAVSIIMRDLVKRAMAIIVNNMFTATPIAKAGYVEGTEDVYTDGDKLAQKMYIKSLQECFPAAGIIAEEGKRRFGNLSPDTRYFFTVDPLDGTKAYLRRQSHGIATMIALFDAHLDKYLAAYIGDVMAQEIYGFRPGSSKVHRLMRNECKDTLSIDPLRTLAEQWVLLRDLPESLRERPSRWALSGFIDGERYSSNKRLFRGVSIADGSIGTMFARLWKGEVGAIMLPTGPQTPWDICPCIAISEQLGFRFLRWSSGYGTAPLQNGIPREVVRTNYEVLVVHHTRLAELEGHMSTFTLLE